MNYCCRQRDGETIKIESTTYMVYWAETLVINKLWLHICASSSVLNSQQRIQNASARLIFELGFTSFLSLVHGSIEHWAASVDSSCVHRVRWCAPWMLANALFYPSSLVIDYWFHVFTWRCVLFITIHQKVYWLRRGLWLNSARRAWQKQWQNSKPEKLMDSHNIWRKILGSAVPNWPDSNQAQDFQA